MGLKSNANYGAKSQLLSHCSRAFRTYDSLLDARNGVGAVRTQTVVVVDANVLLMSAPSELSTLDEYVNLVFRFVEQAMGTGWLTVLVYDEPAAMTTAKRAEQAKRDAAKKLVVCSEDIDPFPFQDDYSASDLEACTCILGVRDKRPCRSRLYDEISRRLLYRCKEKCDKWNASGKEENFTVVVFDGVDMRGCDRPAGESRDVRVQGTDDEVASLFARHVPIGEGDIKLQDVEDKVRQLVDGGKEAADGAALPASARLFRRTNLVVHSTVDTDSLMISCIAVSKRRMCAPRKTSLHSVLCMRSPPPRHEPGAQASYLTIDIAMLEACVLEHLFGRGAVVDPQVALHSMLALAASTALSGCDFVHASGARFDHFFHCVGEFARAEPHALKTFSRVLTASNASEVRDAASGLTRLCVHASMNVEQKGKRYAKQAKQIAEVDAQSVMKAVWTAAYWSQNEIPTTDAEFGF